MYRKQKYFACFEHKLSDIKFTTFIFANLKCFGIFAPLWKKAPPDLPDGEERERKKKG
jgi:hypothetical protein